MLPEEGTVCGPDELPFVRRVQTGVHARTDIREQLRRYVGDTAITTAGFEKAVEGEGMLPNYTTFNLAYTHKLRKYGTINVGILNVAGSTPPIDDSNPNDALDTSLFDQIGRQYYTGYKATF